MRTGRRPRLIIYTDADEFGGAEQSAGNLVAALDEAIDVAVVGTTPLIVEAIAARRAGTELEIVPPVRGSIDRVALRAHIRAMRRLRPDICQLNLRDPYTCTYGFLAGLVTPGVKIVAVEHLPIPTDSRRQRLVKNLQSRLLAAHIAVGDCAARQVEDYVGLAAGTVVGITNGVPDAVLEPVHRLAKGPVVGSVGRFHVQKGFDVLIRAVAQMEGVTLVLVGDGPARPELLALAEREGMTDRLILPGWQAGVGGYLAGFDVFALPSRFEGFPLAIVEAMLAGLPVVATTVGSVSESVFPEKTGVLVPPGDVEALRNGLARLLADEDTRAAMGRRARELAVRRFDCATMARAYEAVYVKVAKWDLGKPSA